MTDADALDLIESIADYTLRHRRSGCLERDELINIGWIAYRKAKETWDGESGATLRTYAATGIRKAIRAAVRNGKPKGYRRDVFQSPNHSDRIEDLPSDAPYPERVALMQEVYNIASELLSAREYWIMACYAEGVTFKELGEDYGISRQRVCKIYNRSIKKMRNYFEEG